MNIPAVRLQVWRKLYENALRFMSLRPWESLYDADLFGVRDPITGRMGYACVLGALRQTFALCVYRGREGLEIHRRIHAGEFADEAMDLLALQNCLWGEFADRADLHKQDLAVIRALQLKCRGRHAYPFFRSYIPGYCPWFLNEEEAGFLDLAFDAAIHFVTHYRSQPDILQPPRDNCHLVYIPISGTEPAPSWTTVWLEPDPLPDGPPAPALPLEEDLHTILSGKTTLTKAWEIGSFIMANSRITDGDRPYYARVLLVVHAESGIVLACKNLPSFEDSDHAFADFILGTVLDFRMLPLEIRVGSRTLLQALTPLAAALNIKLKFRQDLPAFREAKQFVSRLCM